MARLIDAENYRNLFNEEFKKTMELIRKGETHLDTLAEGFTEADRVIRALPTIDPVTAAAEALGMSPDRLRELAQAEKTGQLVVLSEPMKPMVYKPNDTDVYCPSCGESLSGGWPLSDADDLRKLCQCPNCGQSIDDTRCEAAEAALEAQRGENNA